MRQRVLIAEDEANIVVSIEFLMRKEGYDVRVTMRGDEVIPCIRDFRPHLLLLDIMLPRRNGYELCEEIRANPEWDALKIVMLSAKGREKQVRRGLELGADAYVTKPFGTRELCDQVRGLLAPA